MMIKTAGLFALSALVFSACATTDHGQRVVGEKVTDMSSSAAMLEAESEKVEGFIQRSGARVRDPGLEAYVQTIADKSAGSFAGEVKVYILEAPVFNAFMMPNGAMGVNTGLLLRAETEDELALVLGHEFGHYLEKHSLERHGAARNTNTFMTFVGVAAAGAYAHSGTYIDTTLFNGAMVAGFYSFNRDQESEADVVGVQRSTEVGYDAGSSIRLWQNLDDEKRASSIRAKRKRHSSLFDTHPTNLARLEELKASVGVTGDISRPSIAARSAYRTRIRPFLFDWLQREVELRDTGATLNLLDRLDDLDEDKGVLLYTRARVIDRALSNKRLKKDKLTRELVAGFTPDTVAGLLESSIAEADAPAVAYRELGNILYKAGRKDDAKTAFQSYLRLAPNAEDAQLINSLIS